MDDILFPTEYSPEKCAKIRGGEMVVTTATAHYARGKRIIHYKSKMAQHLDAGFRIPTECIRQIML